MRSRDKRTIQSHLDQVVPHFALLGPDGVHLLLQADLHHVPHPVPRPPLLPRHQAGGGHPEGPLGLVDGGDQLVPGLGQLVSLGQHRVQLRLELAPPVVGVAELLLQSEVGVFLRVLRGSTDLTESS